MVKIEEQKEQIKFYKEQLYKQRKIGNWKKVRDFYRCVNRLERELSECQKWMKATGNVSTKI